MVARSQPHADRAPGARVARTAHVRPRFFRESQKKSRQVAQAPQPEPGKAVHTAPRADRPGLAGVTATRVGLPGTIVFRVTGRTTPASRVRSDRPRHAETPYPPAISKERT
ncbi:hypothetical protein JCM10369A_07630 [Nocardioides pyridinolyticus]